MPLSHKGPEVRSLPLFIRCLRVLTSFTIGMGYIIGSDSLSGSAAFYYVRLLPVTLQGWGVIFILCGLVTLWTNVFGYMLTCFVWFSWSVLIFAALIMGHAAIWGAWVWPMQFAFANMYELTVWGRRKVMLMKQHDALTWSGFIETIGSKDGG